MGKKSRNIGKAKSKQFKDLTSAMEEVKAVVAEEAPKPTATKSFIVKKLSLTSPKPVAEPPEQKGAEEKVEALQQGVALTTLTNEHNIKYTKILTVHPETGKPVTILAYNPKNELPAGSSVTFTFGKFGNRLTANDVVVVKTETEYTRLIKILLENECSQYVNELKMIHLSEILEQFDGVNIDKHMAGYKIIGRVGEMFIIQ